MNKIDIEIINNILDIDKKRGRYYQFFTGQNWGEKLNYDWCINTSDADIEAVVDVIARLLK